MSTRLLNCGPVVPDIAVGTIAKVIFQSGQRKSVGKGRRKKGKNGKKEWSSDSIEFSSLIHEAGKRLSGMRIRANYF